MKILITAGPTREPIDPVRYLSNRSSGQMGAALADAALRAAHAVTLIVGPVTAAMPPSVRRIDLETTQQMHDAVMREFPAHDLLIMAAAPADFRPKLVHPDKLARGGQLLIECEATPDIIAAAGHAKRPDQRTIAFSLEASGDLERARHKLLRKKADLIVYNPTQTMNSCTVDAVLIYPDGRSEPVPARSKSEFAQLLLTRAVALFA